VTADGPYLSVIIPTRDRPAALTRTLSSLFEQGDPEGGFEIVVADNGSGDETRRVLADAERVGPLKTVEQPEGGPAAARNAAVGAADGELLLLLGDDTEPAAPDLLAKHAVLHRARPEHEFACLGRIDWSPRAAVTDFMRWLDRGGPQFHYWKIEPGPVAPDEYFYSSHLSLKRSLFEEAGGFDPRFPYAAVEDTDLGARLADLGMSLEYHPELLVWHDHPTTIGQSLDRAVRVGRSAALYNEIRAQRPHPSVQEPSRLKVLAARLSAPLLGALARLPAPAGLRERAWFLAHRARYATGYRLGPPRTP
jgi:GT2 family glycosyltransferase